VAYDSNMGDSGRFPSTRWSVIEGARSVHTEERQRALGVLVSAYWKPVYKYIRLHWNKENEDAQDLTQDFFARLLEKQLLDRFDPGRARLRTYLRACIDGLVMNSDKSSQRLKRGGEVAFLALDFESAEGEMSKTQVSPPGNPEEMFAHEFARSLFGLAVDRLRRECEADGKGTHFRQGEVAAAWRFVWFGYWIIAGIWSSCYAAPGAALLFRDHVAGRNGGNDYRLCDATLWAADDAFEKQQSLTTVRFSVPSPEGDSAIFPA